MKKPLVIDRCLMNQKGVLLPYFMLIILLSLITVSASITIYQNHLKISVLDSEQIKLDTLLQMARAQFEEEIGSGGFPTSEQYKSYTYTYGSVGVVILPNYIVEFRASTTNNSRTGYVVSYMNIFNEG